MAAYNPRGAEPPGAGGRDEGYLYWLGWFAHNGVSLWNTAGRARADAPPVPDRRAARTCAGLLEVGPSGPVLGGIADRVRAAVRRPAECATDDEAAI